MTESGTIAALATACGRGALAVIRVSGSEAHAVVGKCIQQRELFTGLAERTLRLFTLVDPESGLPQDRVTLIRYDKPVSFTGEDMVEIICHGGQFVEEKVLQSLLKAGVRIARKGEFSRRALLNGKMSLYEAEALNALIDSGHDAEHRGALRANQGVFKSAISDVREKLAGLIAEAEARIEFPEEDDIAARDQSGLKKRIREMAEGIGEQLRRRAAVKRFNQGMIVAIVGIPNAGKSTLFNSILGQERSLVHWQSGTTRDWISEKVIIAGMGVTLVDTAGMGQTENEVEAMGMRQSWELVEKAQIAVWVTPADVPLKKEEIKMIEARGGQRTLCIVSKTDIADGKEKTRWCEERHQKYVKACLKDPGEGNAVTEEIEEAIRAEAPATMGESIIINERQEMALRVAQKVLECACDEGEKRGEIMAHHLREAADAVAEFAGETVTEEILDRIFETFCIGK